MEAIFSYVLPVSLAITIVIGVYITLLAFEKDVWWGLSCFLAGIGTIAFMIEHWKDYKLLFAVYITSFVVLVFSFLGRGIW